MQKGWIYLKISNRYPSKNESQRHFLSCNKLRHNLNTTNHAHKADNDLFSAFKFRVSSAIDY